MSERLVLAVPSMGEGGLDAVRSGHFGHADCFTVVEIVGDAVANVRTVQNPPHEHGGCLRPVDLLAAEGVEAILAAGMGANPLAGFARAGITVYFENQMPLVRDAVEAVVAGNVQVMDERHTCRH